MATTRKSTPADSLRVEVAGSTETEQGLRIQFTLSNTAERALHYIAEPRGLSFDAASDRLTVRLHDVGRELVPGSAQIRPDMRFVEPGATVEASIVIPTAITRLVPSSDGDLSKVAFETVRIADAAEIEVEIAWADTPFYEDPRPNRPEVFASVVWQQHLGRALLRNDAPPRRR
jgi:hypothetical protein